MQTTIFLNGTIPRGLIVEKCISGKSYIIAADGGANYLNKKKILPNIIIGDLDSISENSLKYFKSKKVIIEKIEDQDTTDFEKCLLFCFKKKLINIIVLGATGTRPDHTLNNFSVLKRYSDRLNIKLIENEFEIFFIKKKIKFKYKTNETVSFLGLPKATDIKTEGLEYQLKGEDLEFGIREGTLNKSLSDSVTISYDSGSILLFKKHFIK
ncbi:MAG: thiamine diphosphokinase [Ignavibacteria bacterium]